MTSNRMFGVAIAEAPARYDRLSRIEGLETVGVALHIGSQIRDVAPLQVAYDRIGSLVRELRARGHGITRVDLCGGLGFPTSSMTWSRRSTPMLRWSRRSRAAEMSR